MANTLLTPSVIAREAALILRNNLVMAGLVYRDHEREFRGARVGDTITVRTPASFSVNEFTSSVSVQDITEGNVSFVLEKHFDVSVAVTAKEWTLSLDQFSQRVVTPAVVSIADAIDAYVLSKYVEVPYFVGTAGDPPDAWADLVAVRKKMNDLKIPFNGRNVVLDTQAEADMLAIEQVTSAEKRGDTEALKNASLARVLGMDWYMDQNVKSHTAGSFAGGNPLVNGAVNEGATTMNIDGGSGTETIKKGDVFTVAGASGQYVFTADKTASGGAITGATFYPAAPSGGFADNAAITIVGNHVANLAFHRNAIALAVVPLELPRGNSNAEYVTFEGIGIRVVFDYSASSKKDTISFDVLCGAKVIQPELAVRVLG